MEEDVRPASYDEPNLGAFWALGHNFSTEIISNMHMLSAQTSPSMRLIDAIPFSEVKEGAYLFPVNLAAASFVQVPSKMVAAEDLKLVSKRTKLSQVRISPRYCKVPKASHNQWKENSERRLKRKGVSKDLCPQEPLLKALRKLPVKEGAEIPLRRIVLHCDCPVGFANQPAFDVIICGPKPDVDRFVAAGVGELSRKLSWLELCPVVIPTKGRCKRGGFCMEAKHVDLGGSSVLLLVEP